MATELQQLTRQVNRRIGRGDVDPEKKQEAVELVNEVQADLERYNRENALFHFLSEYIAEQREAYSNGERTTKVCTCTDSECPIKRGKVDGAAGLIRGGDGLEDSLLRFKHDHQGEPKVLIEGMAEWRERRAEIKKALRSAIAKLSDQEETDEPELR
jgi:hypothetical protein